MGCVCMSPFLLFLFYESPLIIGFVLGVIGHLFVFFFFLSYLIN